MVESLCCSQFDWLHTWQASWWYRRQPVVFCWIQRLDKERQIVGFPKLEKWFFRWDFSHQMLEYRSASSVGQLKQDHRRQWAPYSFASWCKVCNDLRFQTGGCVPFFWCTFSDVSQGLPCSSWSCVVCGGSYWSFGCKQMVASQRTGFFKNTFDDTKEISRGRCWCCWFCWGGILLVKVISVTWCRKKNEGVLNHCVATGNLRHHLGFSLGLWHCIFQTVSFFFNTSFSLWNRVGTWHLF